MQGSGTLQRPDSWDLGLDEGGLCSALILPRSSKISKARGGYCVHVREQVWVHT